MIKSVLGTLLISLFFFMTTQANAQNNAMVSFTFDDGFASTYENALPILSARNIPGVAYVTTNWIDSEMTGDNFPAMSWQDVLNLQNQYGWEIGSHSISHPELVATPLEQVSQELVHSKQVLASRGLHATSFASPYGSANDAVVAESLKTYSSHRGFTDRFDTRDNKYNNSNTVIQSVEEGTSVSDVQSWVDQALALGHWLILVFHNVSENYDPNYQWTTTNSDLSQIADYVKGTGIKTVKVNEVVQ